MMGLGLGKPGRSGPRVGPMESAKEGRGGERTVLKTLGSRGRQNRDRTRLYL